MNKTIRLGVAICGVAFGLLGCGQTSRYVTAEHWHDDNSFFIAFTEYDKTNYVVTSSGSSTAHVILCRAGADNSASCRPQVAVDRLLNPDEEIADPPPAPAAPAPAPTVEAPAEPAAEPTS